MKQTKEEKTQTHKGEVDMKMKAERGVMVVIIPLVVLAVVPTLRNTKDAR